MGWTRMPHVPVSDVDEAIRGFVVHHLPPSFAYMERAVREHKARTVPYCYITLKLKCHLMSLVRGCAAHPAKKAVHTCEKENPQCYPRIVSFEKFL